MTIMLLFGIIVSKFMREAIVRTFSEHKASVRALAWSPFQHGVLVTGGGNDDKSIKIWNINKDNSIFTIETESQVCNIGFCEHSNQFVSTHGQPNNEIRIWNFASRELIARLKGHEERVLHLGIEPNGENIATAAGDETLRFWTVFPKLNKEAVRPPRKSSIEGNQINFR